MDIIDEENLRATLVESAAIWRERDALLAALEACVAWADDLQPYAEDGTFLVPVFQAAKEVIAKARGK